MDDRDPMEIERDRDRAGQGEWEPDAGLIPGAGLSSLEDPDAVEEDDLLDENVDDEREAGLR